MRISPIAMVVALIAGSAVSLAGQVLPGASATASVARSPGEFDLQAAADAAVYIKVHRIFRNQLLPTGGSGFFVSPRGHVLTNWHVVAPQIELNLDGIQREISTTSGGINVVVGSGTPKERTVVAKVVTLDRKRDLALLHIPVTQTSWLRIGASGLPKLADPVWVVGFPFGDLLALNKRNPEVTVSSGRVTAIRHDEKGDVEAVQTDAAVNPGNSGGPLLDATGAVAGVIRAGVLGGDATSLAVAPERVRAFVADNQVKVSVQPDAIYSRAVPLRIQVSSGLADVTGLRGEVRLEGTNIEAARQDLRRESSGFVAELPIPAARADGAVATSYTLVVRLAGDTEVPDIERRYSLPLREGEVSTVRSDRNPSDMMRDRRELANATETSHLKRDNPDPTTGPKGAPRDDRNAALSRLAKDVKLRKSDAGTLKISDHSLYEAGFAPPPESYEHVPAGAPRDAAVAFDKAEFELRMVMRAIADAARNPATTYSYGWYSSYYYYSPPVRTAEEQARFRKRLNEHRDSLLLEAEVRQNAAWKEGLCRCPGGAWYLHRLRPGCSPCEVPEVERP